MNKLYFKLMKTNIKNGKQFYFPYILAGMLMVIMFYSMRAIYYNEGLEHMIGGSDIKIIMNLGTYVIVIFSFIFIFYTNSFIMKRRKKILEFTIYLVWKSGILQKNFLLKL